jgi:hypothetical protein
MLSEYDNLLDYAQASDVMLFQRAPMTASIRLGADCAVFVNELGKRTRAEKTVSLCHELGHCATGAFYAEHSKKCLSRSPYENFK